MFGLDLPCFAGGNQNMLTDEGETTVNKNDKPVDKGVDGKMSMSYVWY